MSLTKASAIDRSLFNGLTSETISNLTVETAVNLSNSF